ncbi:MAG: Tn7 transposase TnsA N-terminal domain-containing protein [Patescibacteria group bacterium]|nr:Tn7 transposase TnsA N-terminal domain-containing protein [Patescibacteria group bacterium]
MNSREKIIPLAGGGQGFIRFSELILDRDPFAIWNIEVNAGGMALLPTRKIPPKRKSFSGYVPFPEFRNVVWYESLLEQAFLLGLRHLVPIPMVLEQPMGLRPHKLGYKSGKYTPDFLTFASGVRPTLLEVKYEEDLWKNWASMKPKLLAARRYARWRGWGFRLVTDRHLLPGGVRRLKPPEFGLVSPYRRDLTATDLPVQKPLIWGALPGLHGQLFKEDRSGLLIPATHRFFSRLFAPRAFA